MYDAKTIPTMYVISPGGTILYGDGIDDTPSTDVSDIPRSRTFVTEALDHAMAGKKIDVVYAHSYGCSVKY